MSEGREIRRRSGESCEEILAPDPSYPIIGRSPGMLAAVELANQVAPTRIPVLLVGETGTGKELFARLIHRASGRTGDLVDVDCGAIPEDLAEGLLFGHRRGAFTGAVDSSEGLIERSHEGTLFLDELGSLPLRGQSKLLRALESHEIRRVGATRAKRIDLRLVSTVQPAFRKTLQDGCFRADLVQRLAGVVIHIPSLAERGEDVLPLAVHFANRADVQLTADALRVLERRCWAGNVRELRWTIERAAVLSRSGTIGSSAIDEALRTGPEQLLDGTTAAVHPAAQLRAACRHHRGDATQVAAALGIGRSTLYRRLRDFGVDLESFRSERFSGAGAN